MSAGVVISIRRKRLIKRFREAGATDVQHAVTPEALGERRSWIFNQMTQHGVFLPTQDGRFFLDDQAASVFLPQRRARALFLTGVVLFVFLVFWILGWLGK